MSAFSRCRVLEDRAEVRALSAKNSCHHYSLNLSKFGAQNQSVSAGFGSDAERAICTSYQLEDRTRHDVMPLELTPLVYAQSYLEYSAHDVA